MFPSHILENSLIKVIKDFVSGQMDISDFVTIYNQSDAISDYLNSVIDYIATQKIPIKRKVVFIKNVNQNKPFALRSYVENFIKESARHFQDLSDEWKASPPQVGAYLKTLSHSTTLGAFKFHSIVADIYYQIDPEFVSTEKYHKAYEFSLDVLPSYLGGLAAENYISQHILPRFSSSIKKAERKRLVKEAIKQAFQRDCKGFPRWIQSPEWPIGINEKPMVYIGQKAFEHHSEYYFRDSVTNKTHTVTQWW